MQQKQDLSKKKSVVKKYHVLNTPPPSLLSVLYGYRQLHLLNHWLIVELLDLSMVLMLCSVKNIC
jgi:hypothetical protein